MIYIISILITETIIRVKEREDVPLVILANKCDLEATRAISTAEGKQFAKGINAPFFETSGNLSSIYYINGIDYWSRTELPSNYYCFLFAPRGHSFSI